MVTTYNARKWAEETDGAGEFVIPDVPDGTYPAAIVDVEDREFASEFGTQLKFMIKWQLDDMVVEGNDGQEHPVTLIQFVTVPQGLIDHGYIHPKAGLYKFLKGIGQNPDAEHFVVDPMKWISTHGIIWVENKSRKNNEMRPEIIKNSLPAPAQARRTAVKARPVSVDDDWTAT